jgi:phosphoribosylformylglycinamidine (FGAM) synthase PurS component
MFNVINTLIHILIFLKICTGMNTEGKNSIQYQYLPEETMQIKEYIIYTYGSETHLQVLDLEKFKCKLSHTNNNIVFLRKCRTHDVIPNGFSLKTPLHDPSPKSEKILRQTESRLISERIQKNLHEKATYLKLWETIERKLKYKLSKQDFEYITFITNRKSDFVFNQVKHVQTKKLQNLNKKKEDESQKKQLDEIESRAKVIGNTVINLTDEPMSENEKLVLGYYGPNFNIVPKELPWKEFVSGFEQMK